jgi:hypothetical protein
LRNQRGVEECDDQSVVDGGGPVEIFHVVINAGEIEAKMGVALFFVMFLVGAVNKRGEILGTKGMKGVFEAIDFSCVEIVFLALG